MIYLSETSPAEYDEYYRMRCGDSDIYWNGHLTKPDRESFRALYLSRISSTPLKVEGDRNLLFVRLGDGLSTDLYVGFVQLIMRGQTMELGYGILDEYQGRGYATDALGLATQRAERYGLPTILRIRDDNIASRKVAAKNGYERTDEHEEVNYPNRGLTKLWIYRRVNPKNT